jgi:hypothetical protein
MDLGLHIDFSDEVTRLSADTMAGYELLIVFRDGMLWPDGYGLKAHYPGCDADTEPVSIPPVPAMTPRTVPWITPEQGAAVRAFVNGGGAALFYHNSTYISPDNEDFRHVQGSITEGQPEVRPYRVEITNKDHPITRGVSDFVVTDEQHYMIYDKDPGHVLAESVNEDGHTFKDLGTAARRPGSTAMARAVLPTWHRAIRCQVCGTTNTRSCSRMPCAGCCVRSRRTSALENPVGNGLAAGDEVRAYHMPLQPVVAVRILEYVIEAPVAR